MLSEGGDEAEVRAVPGQGEGVLGLVQPLQQLGGEVGRVLLQQHRQPSQQHPAVHLQNSVDSVDIVCTHLGRPLADQEAGGGGGGHPAECVRHQQHQQHLQLVRGPAECPLVQS